MEKWQCRTVGTMFDSLSLLVVIERNSEQGYMWTWNLEICNFLSQETRIEREINQVRRLKKRTVSEILQEYLS